MGPILFRYRSRELTADDLSFINTAIKAGYARGRSHISTVICKAWQWKQPNGKLKEYAARDLLLRLEENGFIKLPPRLRPKNNLKVQTFDQVPLFIKEPLSGLVGIHDVVSIRLVASPADSYLWQYLVHHHHYLGLQKLVGEHVRHLAFIGEQVVACIGWASAAWKMRDRDRYIGWDEITKRRNLHNIANNVRFLILPWIRIKHLASKVLALSLRRLCEDWRERYGHEIYLAETFVDTARFEGTCYRAANWHYVGQTKGSAKRGNRYHRHGNSKAIYLYPLHRKFRRMLTNETR